MNEYIKKYTIILSISLLVLIIEAFLIRLGGAIGLILCIASIYLIIGSIIKLLKVTDIVKGDFLDKIDILFFLK
jgi:succinate-acetate transporter protein